MGEVSSVRFMEFSVKIVTVPDLTVSYPFPGNQKQDMNGPTSFTEKMLGQGKIGYPQIMTGFAQLILLMLSMAGLTTAPKSMHQFAFCCSGDRRKKTPKGKSNSSAL